MVMKKYCQAEMWEGWHVLARTSTTEDPPFSSDDDYYFQTVDQESSRTHHVSCSEACREAIELWTQMHRAGGLYMETCVCNVDERDPRVKDPSQPRMRNVEIQAEGGDRVERTSTRSISYKDKLEKDGLCAVFKASKLWERCGPRKPLSLMSPAFGQNRASVNVIFLHYLQSKFSAVGGFTLFSIICCTYGGAYMVLYTYR
jgi:hypothetical protein